jgi:hypothetical protein
MRCCFSRFLIILALFAASTFTSAQGRVSDSDLQKMLENVRDDAKSFRHPFESALKNSTIRKTTAEKNAKALGETFEHQTKAAVDEFKHGHHAGSQISAMFVTAHGLNSVMTNLQATATLAQWTKISRELEQISSALGQPTSFSSALTANTTQASVACRTAVGAERSQALVTECMKVSSAAHPPCNDQNSCVQIIDEIKRGCGLLGQDAPQFCLEYKPR